VQRISIRNRLNDFMQALDRARRHARPELMGLSQQPAPDHVLDRSAHYRAKRYPCG
jgi:hypothetical protein